jgi:hypothetical protein
LGRFFLTSGHILGPGLNGVGLWVEKHNSSFPNRKSYLDTHLGIVHVVFIASEDVQFLGHFFSTSSHILGPSLNGVGLWVEKHSCSFPNRESYSDTHLGVFHVVLIGSKDV